jgi:hypothetical protein
MTVTEGWFSGVKLDHTPKPMELANLLDNLKMNIALNSKVRCQDDSMPSKRCVQQQQCCGQPRQRQACSCGGSSSKLCMACSRASKHLSSEATGCVRGCGCRDVACNKAELGLLAGHVYSSRLLPLCRPSLWTRPRAP